MQGYRIIDLNEKTAQLIRDNNIDKNHDRLINEENGELAELLSQAGAKDINELINEDYGAKFFLSAGLVSALCGYGSDVSRKISIKQQLNLRKTLLDKLAVAENQLKKISKSESKTDIRKYFKISEDIQSLKISENLCKQKLSILKNSPNFARALMLPLAAIFGGLGLIHLLKKPKISMHEYKTQNNSAKQDNTTITQQNEQKTVEQNTFKETYTQAFRDLGISENTELKEYTPQRGEYWISILKAKYGTDDVTAQKMANKIKEMIYDDPTAAKQTPVMYLPETWTFEGKTYHYNENAPAAVTQDYSDDVQTEMGKMSKDLKYE